MWEREEIAPEEQFLLLSTIFCCLLLDFHMKAGTRFSPRDKRLFEITDVEITRVDCIKHHQTLFREIFQIMEESWKSKNHVVKWAAVLWLEPDSEMSCSWLNQNKAEKMASQQTYLKKS